MIKKTKIFVIAGEVSGDVLGGELMREFGKTEFDFVGVGGDLMKNAGLKSLFSISDLSVMGLAEAVKKFKTLLARIKETADAIIKEQPDIVLTIDSPSFAARVVKKVRKSISVSGGRRPKFYHVVAPMVWAWGPGRAKKYAKIWDKLFCFFDFEKPYFTKYGLDTVVIGFPFYNVVRREMKAGLSKKYVAMLPGSRPGASLNKVMAIYEQVAAYFPKNHYAIPVTETTKDVIERMVKTWPVSVKVVPFDERYRLYSETKFAVSLSGVKTAELAIMNVPTIIIQKLHWFTGIMAKFLLKTKWGLANILAGREIMPELIGRRATAKNIIAEIEKLDLKKMMKELRDIDDLWHKRASPMRIVKNQL